MTTPNVPPQPAAPKKKHTGRKVLIGLILGVAMVSGCSALLSGGGDDSSSSSSASKTPDGVESTTPVDVQTSDPTHTSKPSTKPTHKVVRPKPKKVVFRVWGSAPSGVDVTYGSDSDNRQGPARTPIVRKLRLHDDAVYYDITAQLEGGGNIYCSVTIDGQTKKGHASGGYNICSAQLNSGFFGGWD